MPSHRGPAARTPPALPLTIPCASHCALVRLPLQKIEEKLSQMILDKKFRGILDAGAGHLIVYEDQQADTTYDQALETLGNMSKVVDALYVKANSLATSEKPKDDKEKKGDDKKDGKEAEAEDKVMVKKKDKK